MRGAEALLFDCAVTGRHWFAPRWRGDARGPDQARFRRHRADPEMGRGLERSPPSKTWCNTPRCWTNGAGASWESRTVTAPATAHVAADVNSMPSPCVEAISPLRSFAPTAAGNTALRRSRRPARAWAAPGPWDAPTVPWTTPPSSRSSPPCRTNSAIGDSTRIGPTHAATSPSGSTAVTTPADATAASTTPVPSTARVTV